MTLEEAVQKAFGCRVNMMASLTTQYFWLTVRFLDKSDYPDVDPRVILQLIEPKVERLVTLNPALVK